MGKIYLDIDVYEAFQQRIQYVFREFENVYISFSGGKDSGLLLNLVVDYIKTHCPDRKIGLFHQDFEAQYSYTTQYVTEMFERMKHYVEPYWVCLPTAAKTPLSNYELYWYPWDDEKKDAWVREMPDMPYVVNQQNNPFDFYDYKMPQEDLAKQFGRWYKKHKGGGETICLLGVRASESMIRYSAIVNKRNRYKDKVWISKMFKDVYSATPIYDWTTEDIWTANAKFDYPYNRLYDLFYKAGIPLSQMRVASPFNEWAMQALNTYRVIEPETWTKLVGRIRGVNFASIYGNTKAVAYRHMTLPAGHTWQSYTRFLLDTLPEHTRNIYLEKFRVSAEFWAKTGGGLPEEAIQEIESKGYKIQRNGISSYTKDGKQKIIFKQEIPDDTDDIKSTVHIPSWKRMCYCILKNDHFCRYMGFGPTKQQRDAIHAIKQKYESILEENRS